MGRGDDEVDDYILMDGGFCQSNRRKILATLVIVHGT